MNRRMVFHIIGWIAIVQAGLMVPPVIVSLIYRESGSLYSFLITIGIALAVGGGLLLLSRPRDRVIYAKEGFAVVSLAWIMLSMIGALPFVFSGSIPSYIDALFETISGFTTTGASILTDVEALEHGILFWRSFTHWVGGMGVLVFIMAIVPSVSDRSIHILRAEVPGPIIGKLVPRIKDTAKILYLIYIALTVFEMLFLCFGGMPIFDSIVHSFGTAGTGGFGIKADSLAGYSPYCQWVITVFMLLFGVNFNLFYLILLGKARSVLHSTELWVYLGIIVFSTTIIVCNVRSLYGSLSETLRHSSFQVASIVTTTGYSSVNFDLWPSLSKGLLLMLMFVGGCAGSTAGGLKIARVMILFKIMVREFRKMLHPRSVNVVKLEGKALDRQTINNVCGYFICYVACLVIVFLVLSFEPFGVESNLSAAVSCLNNIGPGFAAVGPFASFADYSVVSKLVLSAAMLLGRLEIYPILLAFSPATWVKRR